MNVVKKISGILSSHKIQRLCYLLALILWLLIWQDDFHLYNQKSSLGIKYLWLIIIPAGLLIIQIAFNNTFTWALIVGIIACNTIWIVITILADVVE